MYWNCFNYNSRESWPYVICLLHHLPPMSTWDLSAQLQSYKNGHFDSCEVAHLNFWSYACSYEDLPDWQYILLLFVKYIILMWIKFCAIHLSRNSKVAAALHRFLIAAKEAKKLELCLRKSLFRAFCNFCRMKFRKKLCSWEW